MPGWESLADRASDPFPLIKHHVLLHASSGMEDVDARLADVLTADTIAGITQMIPDAWLEDEQPGIAAVARDAYRRYLVDRLRPPRPFVEEILRAR
jgi:hypothetical protein